MITEILEILSSLLFSTASSILGISEGIIEVLFKKRKIAYSEKKQQDVLSEKINQLTVSLHKSSQLMNEIEVEFERQKELAQKWEEEADTCKKIAELHQSEIEAVSKILGKQLKNEGKRADRKALFWNIVFCVLGILGGHFIPQIFSSINSIN